MNERELAERIARHLDQGLDDLPPSTLYRLRLAREKALSQLRDDESTEATPAAGPSLLSRRLLVPLFALIITLSGLVMWQQHTIQNTSKVDLAELDAQVLSDELPVTAYLDQGFEVWLHHTASE
jgi:Protein of unknown function (DUF3619)